MSWCTKTSNLFRWDARGSIGALSTTQAISIVIVIGAVVLFISNRKRVKPVVGEDVAEEAAAEEEAAEKEATAERASTEEAPTEKASTEEAEEETKEEPEIADKEKN